MMAMWSIAPSRFEGRDRCGFKKSPPLVFKGFRSEHDEESLNHFAWLFFGRRPFLFKTFDFFLLILPLLLHLLSSFRATSCTACGLPAPPCSGCAASSISSKTPKPTRPNWTSAPRSSAPHRHLRTSNALERVSQKTNAAPASPAFLATRPPSSDWFHFAHSRSKNLTESPKSKGNKMEVRLRIEPSSKGCD